jgi:hypothetical protein
MNKILFALGTVLLWVTTAHSQVRVVSDPPELVETQSAQFSFVLVEDRPLEIGHPLPAAPKPIALVQPAFRSTPCPGRYKVPCALLGGKRFIPDPFHMTEHDKTWAKAIRNPAILWGISMNVVATVVDYKTTRHCIDTHRGKEANPLMGQSRAQELSVGIGLSALTYYFAGRLKKQGDGNFAFGALWVGTALHSFAASASWAGCHG